MSVPNKSTKNLSVLVTGASGLLGRAVVATLQLNGCRVHAHTRNSSEAAVGDAGSFPLEQIERIAPMVEALRPSWIVHTAASVNLDACQRAPAEAEALHVHASRELALAANRCGSRLLYVSTDSVYDGDRSGLHTETAVTRPLNAYARTKLEGERACCEALPSTVVGRVNFFGLTASRDRGLVAWIVRELSAGRAISGFADVWFSPLVNYDLAQVLVEMVCRDLSGGIYNVGAGDACSKYDFARRIARLWHVDPALVREARLADSGLTTPRPRNTTMATEKLQRALGRTMPTIDEGLAHLLAGLNSPLHAAA